MGLADEDRLLPPGCGSHRNPWPRAGHRVQGQGASPRRPTGAPLEGGEIHPREARRVDVSPLFPGLVLPDGPHQMLGDHQRFS